MKTKLSIIALLILALLGAFTLKANAQDRPFVAPPPELLADETTITYTKTEAKVETVNDSVFLDLLKSHQQLFKRYTCTWKHDKKETYKLYVIYLNKDDAAIIVKWAKTNL